MTAGPAVTSPAPARVIRVEADLEISVDGVPAHLHGLGDQLVLQTSEPARLWRATRHLSLPAPLDELAGARRLAQLGDALARAGLRLQVEGPHGVVVSLGRDLDSRLGRLATGSAAVRPGGVRAVALAASQRWGGRTVLAAIGTPLVAAAIAVVARRRRRARSSRTP